MCVLVSSVMRLLVYSGTCDTAEPITMICSALRSTHEGGEVREAHDHKHELELTTTGFTNLHFWFLERKYAIPLSTRIRREINLLICLEAKEA